MGPAYTERYVYDGEHLALKFDGSALANRYLHGPVLDQILADEQVDSLTSPGDVLWPLTDNVGTVRDLASHDAVTDTTTIANHITYNAFGGITAETNAAVDHLFAYTGREWDAEAELQYNRARWYDPAVGRWISEDPIGFEAGDENLYRYVGNKPTNTTDPSGLWGWDDDWIELGFFGLIGYHGDDLSTAAGVSIINNPARKTLDRLSIVDPTPLSGGTNAVLSGVIEGQSATEIGGNVLLEVLPGPSPRKAKTTVGAAQHGFSHAPKRGPYRGGSHSDTSRPRTRGDGLESHHMPDRGADPTRHPNDGPAIQMDPPDHHATSSNGRHGAAAARYRAETARMIREGRYRDAMAREIRDGRRAADEVSGDARKYNEAIQEMLEYARESGQLPGRN